MGATNRFDPDSKIESWVFSAAGSDVADLFKKTDIRIFARNIRGFLGTTDINKAMAQTVEIEPALFWYFNNGVTIVCNGAEKIEQRGEQLMRMSNPQIINGQQTTRVLSEVARAARASVLVRVIAVPREPTDRFESLVSKIVQATNWQNQIRASDLMANDRRQIELERQLRQRRYLYVRKRQTRGEARRASGMRSATVIKKDEMAQAVAGCELDPQVVRAGKEGLFAEPLYSSIFGASDPEYYLCRFWLMKHVEALARGKPEWAYAKWLVLHELWQSSGSAIHRQSATFVRESERKVPGKMETRLDQLGQMTYRAVMSFYRQTRGSGQAAQDVSTFFNRQNRHKQFESWLRQDRSMTNRLGRAAERLAFELQEGS